MNGHAQESRALAENADSATKRLSEKYTVMRHGNGLSLITTNEPISNHPGQRLSLYHSCVARCSAQYPPPPFPEKISYLAVIMGDYRDSGHRPGLDEKAKRGEI